VPFDVSEIRTPRLRTAVWTAGPEDGVPLLLVHGNLVTAGWWRYVVDELPDDVRVIAPDLRGFGRSQTLAVDATRGCDDFVDDLRSLLEVLGLADGGRVNAAGWSLGGAVLQRYHVRFPDDLASIALVASVPPFGMGSTKDDRGTACYPDFAGSGGGCAAPTFVQRLAARDRSEDDPISSVPVVMRTLFGPRGNAANVDEEFLIDEVMRTAVGPLNYPGSSTPSPNWPNVGPGSTGLLNAISPRYFDASSLAAVERKVPISWIRGTEDPICSDHSLTDFGNLGQIGAVPGWPGADVMPPQPMDAQIRFVLTAYAAAGGTFTELAYDGVGHGIPVEVPARLAADLAEALVR
jgi:pimeloyl-ACP methyl ester carboxylesterase